MALAQWWMILIAAGVLVLAVVIGIVLGLRGTRADAGTPGAQLARAERVRDLPSFVSAVRTRRLALSAVLVLGALAMLAGGVAAARPQAAQTIQPVDTSRDIMLCLDVSGSMSEVDVEVIDVFLELLPGFDGERIGLTIFNSSPVQVFPLTDDYPFIRERLTQLRESFDYVDDIPEHWSGTLNGNGGSLIGDGLTACAMRFDHLDDERSRSIIFASDNEVNGSSIVTVPEAAAYAEQAGVRVFAINPMAGKDAKITAELRAAAEYTGGRMYDLRGDTTVADIVDDVQAEQATELAGEIQVVWADEPDAALLVLAVLAFGFIAVVWRVRL